MFNFEHSFHNALEGHYALCPPEPCNQPSLVFLNHPLAASFGLDFSSTTPEKLAGYFSGNQLPETAKPIAQTYAGHQFGRFNPQLGDGRALILGEIADGHGQRFDLCLKGSGRTPFSRGGDGRAALGPMLREVLISESLHALGAPGTRSLAVVATGDPVYRDQAEPGAILVRTAASHIRIGSFEYFAARQQPDQVKLLADYSIARHYKALEHEADKYPLFLKAVIDRQAALVAQWMSIGFIHGVMNTDNMLISGETIDFGPCAFIEAYDPDAVFSSIDHNGRYAYKNQPAIAQWNLARFAECLLPLLHDEQQAAVELATELVESAMARYQQHWQLQFNRKLGLEIIESQVENDRSLIDRWLALLQQESVDFTQGFQALYSALNDEGKMLKTLFNQSGSLEQWLSDWRQRLELEQGSSVATISQRLAATNPRVLPRNHLVEHALEAASAEGDFTPFERLLAGIQKPFSDCREFDEYASPASTEFTRDYRTFCGT